jgi:uncharacterized protein YlxP (DUF503 family)
MIIGVLRIRALLRGAHSLKDKRSVLRSVKDRVRHAFNVSIAEVDAQDVWQTIEWGVAAVGTDTPSVQSALSDVLNLIRRHPDLELTDHDIETFS